MSRYTEGVCEDGAAILLDGEPVKVEKVIELLNDYAELTDVVAQLLSVINSIKALTQKNK